jgi:hypothetical protein
VAELKTPVISYTQLSLLDDCSLAWYFKYVKKIGKPQTIYMFAGTCFHEAMQAANLVFISNGNKAELDYVIAVFDSKWDKGIKSLELLPGQSPKKFKANGLAAVEKYWSEVGRYQAPDACEVKITKDLPGMNCRLIGIVDMIRSDNTLVDYKLTTKKWNEEEEAATNTQATTYTFLTGKPYVDFEFHVVQRKDKPKVDVISMRRDYVDVEDFLGYAKRSLALMSALREGTVPPEPRDKYCSELLCQYYRECQAWKYGINLSN